MNPSGVLVMDDASVILAVNRAVERIFGYTAEELVGKPLSVLIPERYRAAHREGVHRYLETRHRNVPWSGVEFPALRKDGSEIVVEIAFGEYMQEGEHVFAGFIRDLTERQRTDANRAAEHGVTRVLASATELRSGAVRVLEAICTALGWELGVFWKVAHEEGKLRCAAEWHRDTAGLEELVDWIATAALQPDEGLPGRVWREERPRWLIGPRGSEFPRAAAAARLGLGFALAFPVRVAGEVEGVMEFFGTDETRPDANLLATVEVIGSDLGQFLRRRRAETERDLALAKAVSARQVAEEQAVQLEAQADELQNRASRLREVQAELERANEELQRSNERLRERTEEAELARSVAEEANQTKSAFLANMSHELRTPINAITGYTDLMELGIAGPLTEQQTSHLGRIKASTDHLLGLVNEILDLAKVEAGQLRVTPERVRVAETVREALDLIGPQAAARAVELVNDVPADEDTVYWADSDRIRQILVNLLSNAVKFTNEGGRVRVSSRHAGDTDVSAIPTFEGWIGLEVEDDGIGIPPEKQQSVFEPFVQVDPSHTRERGGTGLGLTISRRLARLMGGDLTVRSAAGQGSCFTLWLPSAPSDGEEGEERPNWERRVPYAPRLEEAGHTLIRCAEEIVSTVIEQLRQDPAIPGAKGLDRAQLGDHTATFLVDIGLALVALEESGGEPALMRDGTRIQRTISDLHGAQRARLAWTRESLRREFEILRSTTSSVLERNLPEAHDAPAGEAIAIVCRLLNQAERVSLRGWKRAVSEPG